MIVNRISPGFSGFGRLYCGGNLQSSYSTFTPQFVSQNHTQCGSKGLSLYAFKPDQTRIGTLFGEQADSHIFNHAVLTYKNPVLTVPFVIQRHDLPYSFGSLIRKYRLENDFFAKELAKTIGVDRCTILNWEKDRTVPSKRLILILKERLNIEPSELVQFGGISERQKAIINLITERGSITRRKCQELLGIRKQYAQNDLYFLYKLGVLSRTLGARNKAIYFLVENSG